MRHWHLCIPALALLASLASAQQKPVDLDVKFRAAERKELVDGDLKGAIEQYRQIVAQAAANRAIAARALLRMAECYQKQGDVEARRIYERVLREYPEQREAATLAQARLGSSTRAARSTTVSLRKVWAGDVLGMISPDGRYLTYVDWSSGNLTLRDFATGADRALTGNKAGVWPASNEYAMESAISRDGGQVAYTWYNASHRRYELRLTSLKGSGVAPYRLLFDNDDVLRIAPYDWSPDGKWIAVVIYRRDRIAQVGMIGVADGQLRVLKSVDWRGPTKVFFSPDGRYLGYDMPARGAAQRDVFVLAVDGSHELPAVAHPGHDIMMGWSPDGKQLLFASDRNGTTGLWALPVQQGKAQGPPEILQANIGSAWAMGLTTSGALYLGVNAGGQDIKVATVDFDSGKRLADPAEPIQRFVGFNRDPEWSPDGRYLAYRSTRGVGAQNHDLVIGVLTLETGDVRDVVPNGLQSFNGVTWAPDSRSFAVGGTDLNGRQGVYRVDAQTGVTEPIAVSNAHLFAGQFPQWSPDAKKIYYRRRSDTGTTVVERELSSGNERLMLPEARRGNNGFSISPDGQWLAVITSDPTTRSSVCLLVPVSGGPTKEILRVNQPQSLRSNLATWSRDGRGVIVLQQSAAGSELLLVPVTGAAPVKLDLDASEIASPQLSVHPDGQRVAFTAGNDSTEVWVLENFLPALQRKR